MPLSRIETQTMDTIIRELPAITDALIRIAAALDKAAAEPIEPIDVALLEVLKQLKE